MADPEETMRQLVTRLCADMWFAPGATGEEVGLFLWGHAGSGKDAYVASAPPGVGFASRFDCVPLGLPGVWIKERRRMHSLCQE